MNLVTGPLPDPPPHAGEAKERSVRQRIRPYLDVYGARTAAHAVLGEPWRAVAVGAPQAAALPAGIRVIDARVEPLGIETHRVGDAQRDHLAILERDEAVAQVGGRVRHVGAEADGVMLVDPGVVARLRAVVAEPLEARARIAIARPALGAVVAGGVRAVERRLALAAVEAHQFAARRRAPQHALGVD